MIKRLYHFTKSNLKNKIIVLIILLTTVPRYSQSMEKLQRSFIDLRFGAFFHFGIMTFTGDFWATPNQDIIRFNPTNLDCEQWVKSMVSAKMKFGIFTTKHHDGFCLWNSQYTDYDIANTPWKNGEGDVVREFVDACRKYNIEPCLYYSIWDNTKGLGNNSITSDEISFVKNQLTELLTNYGDIKMLFIDGWSWKMGHVTMPYDEIRNLVKKLQPNCLLVDNTHLLCLFENDLIHYEANGATCFSDNIYPAIQSALINKNSGNDWFWDERVPTAELMSVDEIVNKNLNYLEPRWCNFILNLPPNKEGKLDESIVNRLKEVGKLWTPNSDRLPLPIQQPFIEKTFLPVNTWASSDTAKFAIDAINDRYFYTVWETSKPLPQFITIDLGRARDSINTLYYVPKYVTVAKPVNDGSIKLYKIYAGLDSIDFKEVASGEWNGDSNMKVASFPSVKARYIKITALSAVNDFAASTEFQVGYSDFSLQDFISGSKIKNIENGIEINGPVNNIKVQFYSDKIVRVTKWMTEGTSEKLSLSVLQKSIPNLSIKVDYNEDNIILSSTSLTLSISKKAGTVKYLNNKNQNILEENDKPLFKTVVYDSDSGYTIQQNFLITKDEGIYGLGEQTDGYFNYRNKKVELVQANVGAANSFLISTNNYGILWDNYSKTVFEENNNVASFWSDMGNNIDYYFIYGSDMDEIISGYRELTGKAPMYGKWAYGYWQSKEHYDTQNELMAVAKKYRKLKIPIDNMIQDWDYWNGAPNWSGMFFDKKLFPTPKEMCDSLHAMNYHIIISIWPALGPKTEIFSEMQKSNFLYKPFGWAGFKYYDAFNPEANKLYWKYLKSGLYSKGLDGWWIDSTEPDVINAMSKESSEYELKKMGSNYLGSWARYLNAFSLVMTDDIYKNWRNETSDKRAYILTRSTFAGQQRNAATTWSGDIGASWEVYRNQIAAGLNHCMSGIPYWTFDIGAFVLGAYDGVFNNGGKDPAYQELYTRMFQFGAFSPIFRSHGSETPREIWEMGEFTKPIIKIDNLRYRLMPYIYSLGWMVTIEDYTYMRGLPMDFSSDKKTYNIDNQFMFGPSIMVCPVTNYMYHKPPEKSVLIGSDYFKTIDDQKGLSVKYYKDSNRKILTKETIEPNININWYSGRPDYVTDSSYSIRWEGKLMPKENGKHQFHLISYDRKRIILNGDTLKIVYTSVEQYTEAVVLEAGKEYNFILESENSSAGASKMKLCWKTPLQFASELTKEEKSKSIDIYLPSGVKWFDFWTGNNFEGGQNIPTDAPIEKIPLFVKAGSIIPMGPFIQYTTEKPADPIELRIYPGADGNFTLYEDENDNYNYEKGFYSTVEFKWDDNKKLLTIGKRNGEFKGMLKNRTFKIVIVSDKQGIGLEDSKSFSKKIEYSGKLMRVHL